ncbi:hypothetical protein C8R44DRAFT_725660 [Mycena epipterygia]|nr:hypothetical protein C8R44DRAFT_725660 [Mycena epipterygia]
MRSLCFLSLKVTVKNFRVPHTVLSVANSVSMCMPRIEVLHVATNARFNMSTDDTHRGDADQALRNLQHLREVRFTVAIRSRGGRVGFEEHIRKKLPMASDVGLLSVFAPACEEKYNEHDSAIGLFRYLETQWDRLSVDADHLRACLKTDDEKPNQKDQTARVHIERATAGIGHPARTRDSESQPRLLSWELSVAHNELRMRVSNTPIDSGEHETCLNSPVRIAPGSRSDNVWAVYKLNDAKQQTEAGTT